jgi:hypothetical protein
MLPLLVCCAVVIVLTTLCVVIDLISGRERQRQREREQTVAHLARYTMTRVERKDIFIP